MADLRLADQQIGDERQIFARSFAHARSFELWGSSWSTIEKEGALSWW
jgi:hypothetical protein